MQIRRPDARHRVLLTLVLSSLALACGDAGKGAATKGKADAKPPAEDPKVVVDTKEPAAAGATGGSDGPGTSAAAGGSAAPTGGADKGTAGDGAPTGGGTAAGSGGAGGSGGAASADEAGADETAGGTAGDAPDPKALLKEVQRRRTKDARAQEALTEAEAAGATPADLAKAANARGKALHASPERAKVFFELALDKDPKFAEPAFNLAKQAAVTGDLDEAKKWLKITHERKGKKLLKQIEYDQTWEILKDDPDVRALLK